MPRFLAAFVICASALAASAQTPAEPTPAPATPAPATISTPAGDSKMSATPTFVLGNGASNASNVKVTLYGFAELDAIYDSTQSFTELQGNAAIAKYGTSAGDDGRIQYGARNSRLGFKIESPETASGIKATGNLEMDFLGAANGSSESGIYGAPTMRMRHGFLKLQTPIIDALFGQTWTVFGASMAFTPATVDIQGVPAEAYQRILQIRLGKTIKFTDDIKFEIEVAALRPFQRDSGMPDLGGFVRLDFNQWKGYKATGSTGGDDSGIAIAFSALTRKFKALKSPAANDTDYQTATGSAIALDLIIPIIPSSKKARANGLTFTAEATTGSGYSDVFTSYNAGVSAIGAPTSTGYSPGVGLDAGPAAFNTTTHALETIDAKSLLLSLQYFTPLDGGNVWLSALYGTLQSDNATYFASNAAAIPDIRMVGVHLFWDVTQAARLGLSWSKTRERFGDNSVPRTNDRVQLSGFYIF